MSTLTYPDGVRRLQGGGLATSVDVKTASYTVTREDSGRVIVANAVDLVFTLPPTEEGLVYHFVVRAPSATTGLQISPAAVDKIMATGITSADDKDLINTAATDAEGDSVTLVGDGIDGWYQVGNRSGTWARQA